MVLNGTKTFITNGHYADVLVVLAVTDRRGAHARAFGLHRGERREGIPRREERK